MQKKTKIALISLAVSLVALTGIIVLITRPDPNNNPIETVYPVEDDPVATITPKPLIEDNPIVPEPEEPKGLTNGQKYHKTLVEPGSKNILLIGKDAVYGAYDVSIVLNIDEKNKKMKLIHFPRDAYIDYNDKILKQFKEADPENAKDNSIQKLNAAHIIGRSLKYKYSEGGKFGKKTYMNFWADLVEEVFGIPIDDYVIINVDGFCEIVDAFGGVEIDVPIYMHYEDPFQDLYIHLEPGVQVLNGQDAMGFVRFRQGYTEEGEFKNYSVSFRQHSQNTFLKAFFEQHVNLSNLGKLGDFVDILIKNVETSANDWSKMTPYANAMQNVIRGKYGTVSEYIQCEPNNRMIRGISYEIMITKQLQ